MLIRTALIFLVGIATLIAGPGTPAAAKLLHDNQQKNLGYGMNRSLSLLVQDAPAVVRDTLALGSTRPIAGDTSQAAVDSTNQITAFGREIADVGQLVATGQFGAFVDRVIEGVTESVVTAFPRLLGAVLVFLLFYLLYRMFGSVLVRLLRKSKRVDAGVESLLMRTYRIIGLASITVMVLAQFGVNVTALLAGLSIAGLAVGFAAKDTLENFISGVTILIDKPFAVGDVVLIDGTYGTVEDLTLRSTRVRTVNNQIMVMPNFQMVNQKLVNYTALGVVRVDVDFGIAYKEFPREARQVVLALTQGDDRLHPDFAPVVVVTSLNSSSVDMQLRIYIKEAWKEMQIRMDYTERIREALREAGIEIPFPHLQLFLDEAKALEGSYLLQPPA